MDREGSVGRKGVLHYSGFVQSGKESNIGMSFVVHCIGKRGKSGRKKGGFGRKRVDTGFG